MPSAAPHQALYRRWRAQTFGQIVGQAAVVETLRNAVRLERLSHGFLFVGPRGTGKTSMARILAKAVNCVRAIDGEPDDACEACVAIREGRAFDVIELDAASNNTVQDMRELIPRVYTATSDLMRKVFIIDEVQRIKEGWDVLLKTLEEPPDDVLFIFCTTNPSQIRPAVVSRLQRFTFRPLTVPEIRGKLERILVEEARTADDEAVTLIAELAAGGMRDAESMLDQLLNGSDEALTASSVRALLGLAEASAVDAFIDALAGQEALAGIAVLDGLEADGRDLVSFADQVVTRLRGLVVARLTGQPSGAPAVDAMAPATLASLGRRVAALDANRIGAGGYRFQLELVLLQGLSTSDNLGGAGRAVAPAAATTGTEPAAKAARRQGTPEPNPATQPEAAAGASPPEPIAATQPEAAASASPREAKAKREPAAEPKVHAGPMASVEPERDPAPAPSAALPTAAVSEPLARLRTAWPEFVRQVGTNPALRAIIEVCRPVEVRDGVVILGFPEDRPFYRDKAEQRRPALEAGVEQIMGERYVVRCVATNLEALGALPSGEEEQDLVARFREIFAGDLADVAEIR